MSETKITKEKICEIVKAKKAQIDTQAVVTK